MRRRAFAKYEATRREYKLIIENQSLSPEQRAEAVRLLNKVPRQFPGSREK